MDKMVSSSTMAVTTCNRVGIMTTDVSSSVHGGLNTGNIGTVIIHNSSVVRGTDFLVGFRFLDHNRNPNRLKFIIPKLSVVINTLFLAIFPGVFDVYFN